jgi:RNA polymerase sigma-70 factor (ECF subfamily)
MTLLERLRLPSDEQAWTRFVQLYTPLLLRWSQRQGMQPSDAADLTQEVLLQLHHKLPDFQYDPNHSFRAWLKVVFLNKCREINRRKQLPTVAQADAAEVVSVCENLEEEQEDRRLLLHRGLELIRHEFSEITWRAFWDYAILEQPVPKVAGELGIALGSVYTARSRVLARLRQEMDRLLD